MSDQPGFDTPAPATPTVVKESAADRERRNPLYRLLMHLGLPVSISLIVHMLLFVGAASYTFAIIAQPDIEVGEYEAGLMESPEDHLDDAFQWGEETTLEQPEVQPLDELDLSDFSRVDSFDESMLDSSGQGPGEGEGDGLGLGEGRFSLLGIGEGAGASGTGGLGSGMGGRGGSLGMAGMWDIRIRANKIVYVVDFSGSILVAVDDLKRELKRSVASLKPSQSFNVIVFYSEADRFKSVSFAPALQAVTEESRKAFFEWLEQQSPRGQTEPLQSIKRALNMRPEAIFFFSDGLFDDSVVSEIARANRAVNASIICFVFDELLLNDTSDTPRETDGARRLRRIGQENRGQTKIVTGRDLRR